MARKKVLLMGKAHSGKTSMRSIIFANYLARDTMRLSPTLDVEHHHVRFLGDLVLNLWDCGGQDAFYESYFERDRETIFKSVELLIYVFDIASECPEKDFDHFAGVLEAIEENSPDARIFVLVHKMDLVAKEEQDMILEDRRRLIEESCNSCGVQNFQCFGTSIWDETLYKAWSEIVRYLIPNIGVLQSHLDDFCKVCDADEVVLFEKATFLVISHSTAGSSWDAIASEGSTAAGVTGDEASPFSPAPPPPPQLAKDGNMSAMEDSMMSHTSSIEGGHSVSLSPSPSRRLPEGSSPLKGSMEAATATATGMSDLPPSDAHPSLSKSSPPLVNQDHPHQHLYMERNTGDMDPANKTLTVTASSTSSAVETSHSQPHSVTHTTTTAPSSNNTASSLSGPMASTNTGSKHALAPPQPSQQQTLSHAAPNPPAGHFDTHRFEKISNIVKQFKLSCEKAQSQFQGMEVSNSKFSAFLDAFTVNTYIMVIVSRKDVHTAATLANIKNARKHFERFIPRS